MAHPQGQVDALFTARIQELEARAAAKAQALRGQGQRPWAAPAGWSGDPLDIAGLTTAYDRSAIAANYAQLLGSAADAGTAGDTVSVKTQSDYVALQERGLRSRYMTPVRALLHAAARHAGHGQPDGVFSDVLGAVQDAIKAGGNS